MLRDLIFVADLFGNFYAAGYGVTIEVEGKVIPE